MALSSCCDKRGESSAPPGTSSQTAVPRPVASSAASPEDTPTEDVESANDQCKFRKNSGRVVSCSTAPADGNVGSWAPGHSDVDPIMALAANACYCAKKLVQQVQACVRMQKTSLVTLKIGLDSEPVDCTLTIRAGTWQKRQFVVVQAQNRDRATIYQTSQVLERTTSGYESYFAGFNGVPGDADPTKASDGVSAKMASEWASLPAELKSFFDKR